MTVRRLRFARRSSQVEKIVTLGIRACEQVNSLRKKADWQNIEDVVADGMMPMVMLLREGGKVRMTLG